MRINYNVTGSERKKLVLVVVDALNVPQKYLGAPTFAFEVGSYHIDKNGILTGEDNEGLVATLIAQGFQPEVIEYDSASEVNYKNAEREATIEPAFEDLQLTQDEELGLGRERHDPIGEDGPQASDVPETFIYRAELGDPETADRMEVFTADNDEDALKQALEFCTDEVVLLELHQLDENYDFVRSVDYEAPEANALDIDIDGLTVSLPKEGFTETALQNLSRLVESKGNLIKKALGVDALPIETTDEAISFPWFSAPLDSDKVIIYTKFISAICEMAKSQKRITATEKAVENEKYAFRCFLLRLGFIGAEFKAHRKILLAKLEGSGAFKVTPNVSEAAKVAENG